LVVADDTNYTQWLDAVLSGIEGNVSAFCSLVTEHNIRMCKGVQVRDAFVVASNGALERSLALCVCGTSASAIIQRISLLAITVDIHVRERTAGSLDIEDIVVTQMVAAVGEAWKR
jgi:hypothetical protein